MIRAWAPDPTEKHQYRWWDGEKWTEHVTDSQVQALDPMAGTAILEPPKIAVDTNLRLPASSLGWAATISGQAIELASRRARFGAAFIDFLLISGLEVVFLLSGLFGSYGLLDIYEADVGTREFLIPLVLRGALTLLYKVPSTAMSGQTLGKKIFRIRVVRTDTGHSPGWGRSFVRWIVPDTVLAFGIVCYLSLTWDTSRQGWHDKAARTVVVKKPNPASTPTGA